MTRIATYFLSFLVASCGSTSLTNIPANDNLGNPTDTPVPKVGTVETCNFNDPGMKERLQDFFKNEGINIDTYKPEEDEDLIFIKEIRSCPREETINSILAFQSRNKNNFEMKAKSSYLLIKLGHDTRENGRVLISTYSEKYKERLDRIKAPNYEENAKNNRYDDRFGEDEIISLIFDVIDHDDGEILSDAFDLSLKVDNGIAEDFSGIVGSEFKKDPEAFLRKLKPKSSKIKHEVYFFLTFDTRKEMLIERVSRIPKSSDVYGMSRGLIRSVNHSKANN